MLLQEPTPTPTAVPHVAREIADALGAALVDYWYVFAAMLMVAIALSWLNIIAARRERRRKR